MFCDNHNLQITFWKIVNFRRLSLLSEEWKYSSRTPLIPKLPFIRTLVILIANYPDRLGPSSKRVLPVTVLISFYSSNFPP